MFGQRNPASDGRVRRRGIACLASDRATSSSTGLQLVDRHRNPANTGVDKRVLFLGDDLEEVPLEVVAVELYEEEFMVIHSMELRDRFRALYEEAKRWER